MKKPAIHVIVAGMRRMKLPEQVQYLEDALRLEQLHSVRHNEIYSLLRGKRTKQLRKEAAA